MTERRVTLESLAIGLRRAVTEAAQHYEHCGDLQKKTATALDNLIAGQKSLEARMAVIDRMGVFFERVSKYGRRVIFYVIGAAVTAWVTVLVENAALHAQSDQQSRQAVAYSQTAASAATSADRHVLRLTGP